MKLVNLNTEYKTGDDDNRFGKPSGEFNDIVIRPIPLTPIHRNLTPYGTPPYVGIQ